MELYGAHHLLACAVYTTQQREMMITCHRHTRICEARAVTIAVSDAQKQKTKFKKTCSRVQMLV